MQAIHIASWHYWEPDLARDAWLARLIGEHPLQHRDVLVHQLLLQRDRPGRDDDVLPAACRLGGDHLVTPWNGDPIPYRVKPSPLTAPA